MDMAVTGSITRTTSPKRSSNVLPDPQFDILGCKFWDGDLNSMSLKHAIRFRSSLLPPAMRFLVASMVAANSWVFCLSAGGQTSNLYAAGLGQSQMQNIPAITASGNIPRPLGSSIAGKSAQISSGVSSSLQARSRYSKQKLDRAPGMNSMARSCFFLFSTGNWMAGIFAGELR